MIKGQSGPKSKYKTPPTNKLRSSSAKISRPLILWSWITGFNILQSEDTGPQSNFKMVWVTYIHPLSFLNHFSNIYKI